MKKSELKIGNVLRNRDGDNWIIINSSLQCLWGSTFLHIDESWSEGLINNGGVGENWDIVRVYKNFDEMDSPIWEREEHEIPDFAPLIELLDNAIKELKGL